MNRCDKQILKDQEVIEKYKNSWGLSTSIDLYNCDLSIMKDPLKLKDFVIKLCDLIDMKRYGEPQIINFGTGRVEGYSLTQLIETSLISGHFANESRRSFIDIFSCKAYGPHKAAEFCKKYFKATDYNLTYNLRN